MPFGTLLAHLRRKIIKMKRILLVLALITLIRTAAFSQESAENRVMSLRDCMLYAVENSAKVGIQQAANDNNRTAYTEAYLKWIPSVSGSTYGYSQFGRSIDPETNTYTTISSFHNGYSVQASYPVFDGFSVLNNYKISKIALNSGIDQMQKIKDEICLQVIQAYCNVLYREKMVQITSEQLLASEQLFEQTKAMEELGLKGQADLLQIEAQVAENDLNHIKEINELANAKLTLATAMFYPLDKDLQIDTTVNYEKGEDEHLESSEDIFLRALSINPAVRIAESNAKKARYNYLTAKYQALPSLYLNAGLSTTYITMFQNGYQPAPYMDQINSNAGGYVQLTLSIPIFSNGKRYGDKVRARNAWRTAELERDQKYIEVQSEIQRALQDLEGAKKEHIQSVKREVAYDVAHQANSKKYKEGLISIIDLQTSSNQLLNAKVQKLNSELTLMIKERVVSYYKGVPYLEQE